MKPSDTLTTLFSHHIWANLRLLEGCAELTSEQLDATIPGAFGSIHDTLQHIATSEQAYFSRISTGQPHRHPEDAPSLMIAEIAESMRTTGSGFIEWAPKVQAGDDEPKFKFANLNYNKIILSGKRQAGEKKTIRSA